MGCNYVIDIICTFVWYRTLKNKKNKAGHAWVNITLKSILWEKPLYIYIYIYIYIYGLIIGGVIVREMISTSSFAPYIPKLYTYLSLATPHAGFLGSNHPLK